MKNLKIVRIVIGAFLFIVTMSYLSNLSLLNYLYAESASYITGVVIVIFFIGLYLIYSGFYSSNKL